LYFVVCFLFPCFLLILLPRVIFGQEAVVESLNAWFTAEQSGVKTLAGRTFDENQNVLQYPHEYPSQTISSTAAFMLSKVR
jgi:hypothetical protein